MDVWIAREKLGLGSNFELKERKHRTKTAYFPEDLGEGLDSR